MIEGTIDCQEARGRFGGYLSGTESSEAAIELEAHLDECIDCRMAFEHRRESQAAMKDRERAAIDFERISQEAEAMQTRSIASALRKQSLQQLLLTPPAEASAEVEPENVVQTSAADEVPMSTADPVANAIDPVAPVKVRRQWKSAAYAVALLSVLTAAILVSANSGSIFETQPTVREPGAVVAKTPEAMPASIAANPVPTAEEVAQTKTADGLAAGETVGANQGLTIVTAKPADVTVSAPVRRVSPTYRRNANRKRVVRRATRRSTSAQQGVRVYNP
jgi:hypothetical protein